MPYYFDTFIIAARLSYADIDYFAVCRHFRCPLLLDIAATLCWRYLPLLMADARFFAPLSLATLAFRYAAYFYGDGFFAVFRHCCYFRLLFFAIIYAIAADYAADYAAAGFRHIFALRHYHADADCR